MGDVVAKGSACFYCKHSVKITETHDEARRQGGWVHDCALGLDNSDIIGQWPAILKCPQSEPRWGFQIGGYYTHMWFEYDATLPEDGGEPNQCLNWHIQSDGDFPTKDGGEHIVFHICDFWQLERFVETWGRELRRRGWIKDELEESAVGLAGGKDGE